MIIRGQFKSFERLVGHIFSAPKNLMIRKKVPSTQTVSKSSISGKFPSFKSRCVLFDGQIHVTMMIFSITREHVLSSMKSMKCLRDMSIST